MDIQRTGLLAVLGILTYVLFLQWNLYTEADNPASAVSAQIQPSTEGPKAGEVPSSSGVAQTPIAPISSNIVADQIIISTAAADMAITLSGGDITQVLLKEFPVSLKNQDQPIPLLDYVSRTYFAQSGLVGADGPDASTNGAPFTKLNSNDMTSLNQQMSRFKRQLIRVSSLPKPSQLIQLATTSKSRIPFKTRQILQKQCRLLFS